MSDIAERLDQASHDLKHDRPSTASMCAEAAAEITRLRALLEEAGKAANTADQALAGIPRPRVNDGAHVVWAVGDDVPEDICVARSWLAALLDKIKDTPPQPDRGKQ